MMDDARGKEEEDEDDMRPVKELVVSVANGFEGKEHDDRQEPIRLQTNVIISFAILCVLRNRAKPGAPRRQRRSDTIATSERERDVRTDPCRW
jgi:hypothetical protein